MIDLRRLALFAHLAESGSLTKTAVALNVAHSGLSRQLQGLEKELGHKLFHRTGRGVLLTENGKKLLPRAKRLLSDAQQLKDEAKVLAGTPAGTVMIGLPASVAELLAGPLFDRLLRKYPQVRIRLVEGLSGHIEELLAEGRIEIGLFFTKKPNLRRGDTVLCRSDLYLIGPPGDRATLGKTVKLSTIRGLRLILPGLPHTLRALVEEACARKGFKPLVPLEVDSMSTMKAVVASGGGYTVSSLDTVSHDIATGRLQAARIVSPPLDRLLVMSATFQKPLTVATRLTLNEIKVLVNELVHSGRWNGRIPA